STKPNGRYEVRRNSLVASLSGLGRWRWLLMQEAPRFEVAVEVEAQRRLQHRLDLRLKCGLQPQVGQRLPLGRLQQAQDFERVEREAPLAQMAAAWAERAAQFGAVAVLLRAERCLAVGAEVQPWPVAEIVEQAQLEVAQGKPASRRHLLRRTRVQPAECLGEERIEAGMRL